jgi:hypothetical protein
MTMVAIIAIVVASAEAAAAVVYPKTKNKTQLYSKETTVTLLLQYP